MGYQLGDVTPLKIGETGNRISVNNRLDQSNASLHLESRSMKVNYFAFNLGYLFWKMLLFCYIYKIEIKLTIDKESGGVRVEIFHIVEELLLFLIFKLCSDVLFIRERSLVDCIEITYFDIQFGFQAIG